MIDLKQIADRLWENKQAKGFNTTNVEREFNLAYGEMAEAYDAWRKHKPDLGEELADVMLYIISLARINKLDLEAELLAKMDKNEQRSYTEINGVMVRTSEGDK